ncbi:lysine exporter LysO family protein [uncultured Ilyobacter sp.]|uniref:lysine exporter LysO family protein n=1 Tax=uncultured Ilyobacter sp. TaxID=544433 RepID=UPI0029C0AE7C|nr:lysine exporter LysO family protein [uncultured Ilyobacter sp.]
MILQIGASTILGILMGILFKNTFIINNADHLIDVGLCMLLLFVGIDMGKNQNIFKELQKSGYKILLLPLAIVGGSLTGGVISSFITDLNIAESSAVSAGLGWYSLSAIELSKYSAELGSIAFLANVFREITSILFIPFIGKYIGHNETIAAAGATSMDTLLPVITKSTSSNTAIISFFTGVILSSLVPVLVPLIIGFN